MISKDRVKEIVSKYYKQTQYGVPVICAISGAVEQALKEERKSESQSKRVKEFHRDSLI